MDHEQHVTDTARTYQLARTQAATARDDLTRAVRAAHDAGVTEYRLAKLADANRSVIRAMIGKPRPK